MSGDDKGAGETIADEAKAVAIEVYKDGAAPTVKTVGSTLGRVVRLALKPLDA